MQFISFWEGKVDILEFFYERDFTKQKILPRNLQLTPSSKILLCGTKYSGKFSLIQSYIQRHLQKEKTLFIDFEDSRADKSYIQNNIQHFINTKEITTLIYYAYTPDITLPQVSNIVIISHNSLTLNDFKEYRLKNLFFKEYIAFEKRGDIKSAFTNFLKTGNYPIAAKIEEFRKEKRIQELLKLTFKENFSIFKETLPYQAQAVSSFFLFNQIKKSYKISKDRFYSLFYQWQNDGYIVALPKWRAKRAAKKIYFFDFTLPAKLTIHKAFPKSFENMAILELEEQEIYYLEPLGIYLPQKEEIIVAIPFGNAVRIQEKIDTILQKNSLALKKITVLTIATHYRYEIGAIECEVVPFYEWALRRKE